MSDDDTDLIIYGSGLVNLSVCALATFDKEAVETEVNKRRPTGISSRWSVMEKQFRNGSPNPCPCNMEPETRRHWLLTC